MTTRLNWGQTPISCQFIERLLSRPLARAVEVRGALGDLDISTAPDRGAQSAVPGARSIPQVGRSAASDREPVAAFLPASTNDSVGSVILVILTADAAVVG